jgi:hypothetical protein
MKRMNEVKKIKVIEIITILASLAGVIFSLLHSNLYDFVFNLFKIEGIWDFSITYISLFLYSALSFVIFSSIYLLNEKDPKIMWITYCQGWLFLIMAVSFYEILNGMMQWATQNVLSQQFSNYPFHFLTKEKDVIFFGALFVFWILEKMKNRIKNSGSM